MAVPRWSQREVCAGYLEGEYLETWAAHDGCRVEIVRDGNVTALVRLGTVERYIPAEGLKEIEEG